MSTNMNFTSLTYAFWGSDMFSIQTLESLITEMSTKPAVIITTPPKPKGRKGVVTPSLMQIWADEHNIPFLAPLNITSDDFIKTYTEYDLHIAIVASFGKIIPQNILEVPLHQTINVHPSLLPLWRGASPLQNTIIYDDTAGVSIMRMDEKMDHGPIMAQEHIPMISPDTDPIHYAELETKTAVLGGKLLSSVIPQVIDGTVKETPQEHGKATSTRIITKEAGRIDMSDNPYLNLRKIRAYSIWPRAFYILTRNNTSIRVTIVDAHIENNTLVLDRVIPEGKKEMDFESFKRGYVK